MRGLAQWEVDIAGKRRKVATGKALLLSLSLSLSPLYITLRVQLASRLNGHFVSPFPSLSLFLCSSRLSSG